MEKLDIRNKVVPITMCTNEIESKYKDIGVLGDGTIVELIIENTCNQSSIIEPFVYTSNKCIMWKNRIC